MTIHTCVIWRILRPRYHIRKIQLIQQLLVLLSSGLVLLHHSCILTPNDRASLLHCRLTQIFTVTVRTQSILNHFDGMTTPLNRCLAQCRGWATSPFGLPQCEHDPLTGRNGIDADCFLVHQPVVFEGVDSSDVVRFLRQGETLALLQETWVLTNDGPAKFCRHLDDSIRILGPSEILTLIRLGSLNRLQY